MKAAIPVIQAIQESLPPLLTIVSKGRLLIVDFELERALICAERLSQRGIDCTLCTPTHGRGDFSATSIDSFAFVETDSIIISGTFGGFVPTVQAADGTIRSLSTLAGHFSSATGQSDTGFDVVLDLQPTPSFVGEQLPAWYYAPGEDPCCLRRCWLSFLRCGAMTNSCNDMHHSRGTEMKNALEKLEMVVISDPYPTHMAVMSERQDNTYLLPTSTQFETYGSVTASNRSLQWREKIIDPLYESKPDHMNLYLLAKKTRLCRPVIQKHQDSRRRAADRGHPARDQSRHLDHQLYRAEPGEIATARQTPKYL